MDSQLPDKRPELYGVCISFLIIAWIATLLRVYVRCFMIKKFGVDDWFMVISLLLFTGHVGTTLCGIHYGLGRHVELLLGSKNLREIRLTSYLGQLFYITSTLFVKLSVSVFLLRVAERPKHVWAVRTVIILTSLIGVIWFASSIFLCYPISTYWDSVPNSQNCKNHQFNAIIRYAGSIIFAFIDWTLGILPIFLVRRLNISKGNKILIAGVLSLAALASAATIVRIPYLFRLFSTDDAFWAVVEVTIWSIVEVGTSIFVGSIATLRPLFTKVFLSMGMVSTFHESRWNHRPTTSRKQTVGYTVKPMSPPASFPPFSPRSDHPLVPPTPDIKLADLEHSPSMDCEEKMQSPFSPLSDFPFVPPTPGLRPHSAQRTHDIGREERLVGSSWNTTPPLAPLVDGFEKVKSRISLRSRFS